MIQNPNWKGYTLDELRIKRLVNVTKIELERTKLDHMTQQYKNGKSGLTGMPIVNKLFGALDYVDYGILAYRIGKRALAMFRRKR